MDIHSFMLFLNLKEWFLISTVKPLPQDAEEEKNNLVTLHNRVLNTLKQPQDGGLQPGKV